MRAFIFLSALLAGALSAAAARAEGPLGRPAPFQAMSEGNRVGFNTDIWSTKGAVVASMGVTGQFEPLPGFVVDLDVPWAAGNFTSGLFGQKTSSAGFGNITVGGHGVFKAAPAFAIHAGLSISVPTRTSFKSASLEYGVIMLAADSIRGFYDMQRLLPGVLFVRAPLGVEARFLDYLYYRGDLNVSVPVPVSEGSDHSPQVILEHADEFEFRHPVGVGLGLRFQAAFALSNFGSTGGFTSGDRAQTAMEPFLQYEAPGRGVYGRIGALLALDNALGPAADTGKLASIRIAVGGKF